MSKRPTPFTSPVDDGKVFFKFHVDKPTTLEAFRGFDGAFVAEIKNRKGFHYDAIHPSAPYLELKTARGIEASRLRNGTSGFWTDMWGSSTDNSRFPFKMRHLPPGTLHFGFDALAQLPMSGAPTLPPVRLSGKWKIDRTKIKTPDLTVMPRKPFLQIRSAKILFVAIANPRIGGQSLAIGEVVFDLQSGAMDEKTSFDYNISEHHFVPSNRLRHGLSSSSGMDAKGTARTRVLNWTVFEDSLTAKLNISGRASVDDRWPLGFQIEPFNFKTAKAGQKLKFKTYPVPLPNS